jgi:hypothetical protein
VFSSSLNSLREELDTQSAPDGDAADADASTLGESSQKVPITRFAPSVV